MEVIYSEKGKILNEVRDVHGHFTIPETVSEIGDYAFTGCTGLTSVVIPDSVQRIGICAFMECNNLENIYISKNNLSYSSLNGVLYNKEKTELIVYPEGKKDVKFIIPDSVKAIRDRACQFCTGFSSVVIPDFVTSIGDNAFDGCTGLTSIEIPDSVMRIGYFAFMYCTGLTSIKISKSLASIECDTFSGCTGLTSVIIPDSVQSIGNFAFCDCTGLASILIPDSVTEVEMYAFSGCINLREVHCRIKDITKLKIKESAFIDCNLSQCTLYVPMGMIESYETHPVFSQFKEVIEDK